MPIKTLSIAFAFTFLIFCPDGFGQSAQEGILKAILKNYYKNEKAIYKGRTQLLFTYCEQPANNEEIFETVNALGLPRANVQALRQKVAQDVSAQDWKAELDAILGKEDAATLKIKVNECHTLEQYQEKQRRFNLNNQRLMIVYRPLFLRPGKEALVKVVFYRSIEHNSGSVLRLTLENDNWVIKEFLNPWST